MYILLHQNTETRLNFILPQRVPNATTAQIPIRNLKKGCVYKKELCNSRRGQS
jgi:hypothetical protein